MKKSLKLIAVGVVLVMIAGAVLGSGLTVIGPRTVQIIRRPERLGPLVIYERPVPLINNSDGYRICLTWRTKEGSYPLGKPLEVNTKVKFLENEGRTFYLVISGTITVTDWKTFLTKFDPKTADDEEIQDLTFLESAGQYMGRILLYGNLDNWYQEFQIRTLLADKFAEEYGLSSTEALAEFIRTKRSWYWALGAMYFHQLEEEAQRNPFPDSSIIQLARECLTADYLEKIIGFIDDRLMTLGQQKGILYEEFDENDIKAAESMVALFQKHLETQGRNLGYQFQREFSEFLVKNQLKGIRYSPQELYAARILFNIETEKIRLQDIREIEESLAQELQNSFAQHYNYNSPGNESLWRAAIYQALENKRLFEIFDDFIFWLKAEDGGEIYLEELARLYQDIWEAIYGAKFDLDFQIIEVPAE